MGLQMFGLIIETKGGNCMTNEEEIEQITREQYQYALMLKDKYFRRGRSGLCYIEDVTIDEDGEIFLFLEYEKETFLFDEEYRRLSFLSFQQSNFKEVDDLNIMIDDEKYQKIKSFLQPMLKNNCPCCKQICVEGKLKLYKEINYLKGIGAVVRVECELCGKLDFFSVKVLRNLDNDLGKFYC